MSFQAGDWVKFEGADGWEYGGKVVACVPRGIEGRAVFNSAWDASAAELHTHAPAPQAQESYLVEGGFGIDGKQSIHWPVVETMKHTVERVL